MNHGDHHGSCSESDNDSGGNDSEAQDFNKTEQEELLADMLEQIDPIKFPKPNKPKKLPKT